MNRTIKTMKRQLALLVVTALCASMMPAGSRMEGRAASSAPEKQTARTGDRPKNPRTSALEVTTWDCVWFGSYWQEDTNGDGTADKNDAKTPIKWRVLSVDGDDAFLLADQNLDCQKYNDTETDVTWETSTIRSWLNGYKAEMNKDGKDYRDNNFLDDAFSKSEQSAIYTSIVGNPTAIVDAGNDTLDKVYLLSFREAIDTDYGFSFDSSCADDNKQVKNSAYAEKQGIALWVPHGNGGWWLRSPGYDNTCATCVDDEGGVSNEDGGASVNSNGIGVRPVLHLNLKASSEAGESSGSLWSYAGKVASVEMGKVSTVKLKQKKQAVTISWKKASSTQIGYYQVCYSTSKKWKKRKWKRAGYRTRKLTIKKLKKNTTYYFRVRAYGVLSKGNLYGAWSKTKKITIK